MDIYSLIKKDHQEVASLFKQLRDARGSRETCAQLFTHWRITNSWQCSSKS